MAALVCWANGQLEVVKDSEVSDKPGSAIPLVTNETAGKLRSEISAFGVEHDGEWFVPGAFDVEGEENMMRLIMAFSRKVANARLKRKGLRHLVAAGG